MKDVTKILLVAFLVLLAVRLCVQYLPVEKYTKPLYEINVSEPRGAVVWVEIDEKKRNVTFDQLHENLHSIYSDYSKFASLFKASKSNVTTLEEFKLDNVNVLILLAPTSDYSQEEVEEVLNAVDKGMTLIVLGEGGSALNKVAFNFGITFAEDSIYDLYNYSMLYKNPKISEFLPSPLTQNVTEIVLYDACSLEVSGDAVYNAVASINAKSSLNKVGRLKVIATSNYGLGKVFAICDSDIFTNENIEKFGNEVLARNLINWS